MPPSAPPGGVMRRVALVTAAVAGIAVAAPAAGQASGGATAQEAEVPAAWLEEVKTLDGIMRAYYEIVSHEADEWPDRERDFFIHHPDALVSITGFDAAGEPVVRTMSIQGYHTRGDQPPTEPFYEWELDREVLTYGNVTHVWSKYATSTRPDRQVTQRGINSIQLFWDGERYWVMSWIYDNERPGNPFPG